MTEANFRKNGFHDIFHFETQMLTSQQHSMKRQINLQCLEDSSAGEHECQHQLNC